MSHAFVSEREGEHISIFGYSSIAGVKKPHPSAVDEKDAQLGCLQMQKQQGLSEVLFQPLQV